MIELQIIYNVSINKYIVVISPLKIIGVLSDNECAHVYNIVFKQRLEPSYKKESSNLSYKYSPFLSLRGYQNFNLMETWHYLN